MTVPIRSALLVAAVAIVVGTEVVTAVPLTTAPAREWPTTWVAAWAAAPQHPRPQFGTIPNWSQTGFADQSVRQTVRTSTGGSHVRIRLSNRYGDRPLAVAGATIAKMGANGVLEPRTLRPLRFRHRETTTLAVGAETTSDPAPLATSPLDTLAVTMYFAEPTGPATFHWTGLTATYRAAGDHRFDRDATAFPDEPSPSWYFLTGVDVAGGTEGTVVAFGDSLTDGYGSTPNTDDRYPDQLAERLVEAGTPRGVANSGIGGNKLLTDSPCSGERGLARFHRDVLAQPGVRSVIIQLGTNDIGHGGNAPVGTCGTSPVVTAKQLIAGHRTLLRSARARNLRTIGVTLVPTKGNAGYYSPEKEAVRDALNHWIRTSGEYDTVLDLETVLADPADPDALRPAFDSGDHVHPNNAGYAAVAAAIEVDDL